MCELLGSGAFGHNDIIDDSVKITLFALKKYRELRKGGAIEDMSANGMWLLARLRFSVRHES